jgi:4-carboxymuconolactone decarboxylase
MQWRAQGLPPSCLLRPANPCKRGSRQGFPVAGSICLENVMSGSSEQFEKGLAVRREVLGKDYVDNSLAKADDFMMAFQNITTEWCWGYAWTRPGLERKTRSMLNLAMLTALSKPAELKLHVKGALANGVSVDEIKEILLHATVYCGIPSGLEAFKAAHEVLTAEGALAKK